MVGVLSRKKRVRKRIPTGLNHLGSDKFDRQIKRYVALVTEIRGNVWKHHLEAVILAQELGRSLDGDVETGVSVDQIKDEAKKGARELTEPADLVRRSRAVNGAISVVEKDSDMKGNELTRIGR